MPPKKRGRKKNQGETVKRVLETKCDAEEYAKITKLLGDRRVTMILTDKMSTMGIIPGRYRKRVWMNVGDIVLVNKRDFQNDKSDILHKYSSDEVKKLHKMREIPDFFMDGIFKCENDLQDNNLTFQDSDDDDNVCLNKPYQHYHEISESILPEYSDSDENDDLDIDTL